MTSRANTVAVRGCRTGRRTPRSCRTGWQGAGPSPPGAAASRPVAQAAADLQSRALPAGAAAAQVGDDRGHKDHRHQENGHAFAEMHGLDDGVGALPSRWQSLYSPTMARPPPAAGTGSRGAPPDGRGVIDADMKQGADHAAGHTDDAAQQHPFSQRRRVCSHMHYGLFPLIHRLPPSFPPVPQKIFFLL